MIQKYFIQRHRSSGDFTIEERAVVDPIPRGFSISQLTEANYALIYRQRYSCRQIEKAVKKGKYDLIETIRSMHFFPVEAHCDAIGDSIIHILKSGEARAELFFNSCESAQDGDDA